jgi:hypothetical protein
MIWDMYIKHEGLFSNALSMFILSGAMFDEAKNYASLHVLYAVKSFSRRTCVVSPLTCNGSSKARP